ncbi:hypothetical protein GGI20_002929 [Coemansia sp. BCRC 34301]|nr:hypothetical protein GGI20_002929 [Coemansia sp. BCRC 34301]
MLPLAHEHAPLLGSNINRGLSVERWWHTALHRTLSVAAAAALLAALHNTRQFRPDDRHAHQCRSRLTDDCFRLGIAWPTVNIALGTAMFVSLLLPLPRPGRNDNAKATRRVNIAGISFRDNRLCMSAAAVGVALVGAATPLAFLRMVTSAIQGSAPSVHEYHGVYWQSHLLFWATALPAFASSLLARLVSPCDLRPAFHWLLALAVVLQFALSALAEGYFTFFTGAHIYEPALYSPHSRFVLISALVSFAAALVPLLTHRRGFYQLDAQLSLAEHKEASAAAMDLVDDDYTTPLTRARQGKTPVVVTPERSTSLFAVLTFAWIAPLMRLGSRVSLESGDLCRLDARDRPLATWRRFARRYTNGRSLVKALALTFWRQLAVQMLICLVSTLLSFGGTFFMQRILRSIRLYNSGNALLSVSSVRLIYLDAIGLLLHALLSSAVSSRDVWITSRLSRRIEGMLTAVLASKALGRRSRGARPPPSANSDKAGEEEEEEEEDDGDSSNSALSNGGAITVMTDDVGTVAHMFSSLDIFYTLPIKFAIGMWFLYNLVGVSAFVGVALTIAYKPLSAVLIKVNRKFRRQYSKLEDERITLITELFQGIRAVKLFGWQSRFVEKVRDKRQKQLDKSWTMVLVRIPIFVAQNFLGSLIFVAVLACHSLVFGHALTADVLYPTMSVFGIVNMCITRVMHLQVWYTHLTVSLGRIDSFMTRAMVQPIHERVSNEDDANALGYVGFSDANFEWSVKPATDDTATAAKTTQPAAASESTHLLSSASVDSRSTATASSSNSNSNDDDGMTRSFTLKDISLSFPIGGLSLIVGPTGSGKSSLLAALIGEMSLTSGKVIMPTADPRTLDAELADGRYAEIIDLSGPASRAMCDIAYVAQEAWLRNATIRENILFGAAYDQQRYEEVLRVCALKPDLRILEAGDRTEIGERGVTLSGGQKQRVALARAVYSSRGILVIDDCLSAVDAHTGRHILTECLVGQTPLMRGRTRILVTHHVSACMPHADYMAVLRDGRITACGTPEAVQSQGSLSREIQELELSRSKQQAESNDDDQLARDDDDDDDDDDSSDDAAAMLANVNDMRSEDEYLAELLARLAEQRGVDPSAIDQTELDDLLVEDEEREHGYVRPRIWIDYLRMCGTKWFWVVMAGSLFVSNSASILKNYWVRLWMNSADGDPSHSVVFWLTTYTLAGVVAHLISQSSSVIRTLGTLRAGRLYHERLFARVISATPRFFDKTPIGRVISRFSRDMSAIDDEVLDNVISLVDDVVEIVSMVVIVSSVIPPFAIIALLLASASARLAIYYMSATRELKRLGSVSRSPLLSLVTEIVTGVESIRAFGAQNQYVVETMNRADLRNQPDYLLTAASRWLSMRTSLAGSVVSFSTTILLLMNLDRIDAGLAGFILMYTTSFSSTMMYFVHGYSYAESSMSSVERINQYLDLEQEAPAFSDPENALPPPPATWPSSGNVEVQDLVVEYVPGKPVIHGISFSAAHGEKIGVVGRTGAGKSTLSLAFLRFIEAAQGRIVLDGFDIAKVGLEELRRNVTIIPQDPVLFNGTIRFNLDPFGDYPDELLWDALKRSHLVCETNDMASASSSGTASPAEAEEADVNGSGRMSGIFKSLDAEIKENGQNLSLGQRQLVAMARALVRRSRLIIMDEATASVDFDTDDRIQRTIRGAEFADSTLFCIAHRLRTVIDYDRVLVMDRGQIAEFDTPWNLLQIKNGVFKSMCEKTGEYKHLFAMARTKANK